MAPKIKLTAGGFTGAVFPVTLHAEYGPARGGAVTVDLSISFDETVIGYVPDASDPDDYYVTGSGKVSWFDVTLVAGGAAERVANFQWLDYGADKTTLRGAITHRELATVTDTVTVSRPAPPLGLVPERPRGLLQPSSRAES